MGEREIEEGYKTIAKSGKNYGFFDNLYINFDYALDIISQENTTYRDVILGMANGMASCLWYVEFQIVQIEHQKL